MSRKTPEIVSNLTPVKPQMPTILKGRVVSVNDPQQEGRILAHFPILGTKFNDSFTKTSVDHYKWIQYASIYGGETENTLRGPAKDGQDIDSSGVRVDGKLSYGFWAIPTVGSTVFCFVADGDFNEIYWFSCKYPQKSSATLFGGNYNASSGQVDGPFALNGAPAEPLYSNQRQAFGGTGYEWLTRAASYNPGTVLDGETNTQTHPLRKPLQSGIASKPLSDVTLNDGTNVGRHMKYTPGYARSRKDPSKDTNTQHDIDRSRATVQNSESTMVGISTPAGATLNFDDRPESCRVVVRSTTGHVILADDTNDRIYIATNKGNNWIELDTNGHIYVYSSESVSIKADGHLNLTANKTLRLWGKEGVHLVSESGDIRNTAKNIHNKVDGNIVSGCNDYSVKSQSAKFEVSNYSVKSSSYVIGTSNYSLNGTSVQIKGSGINLHGSTVNIKGSGAYEGISKGYSPGSTAPAASVTAPQTATEPESAYWTNITPDHEPWARTYNGTKGVDELFNHQPQHQYDDSDVNRDMQENGDHQRGPLWSR